MKQRRLRGSKNAARIFSCAYPITFGAMSVRCLRRDVGATQFLIAIPGTVIPGSVRRNTLRRKIREHLRRLSDAGLIREGFDVAIVVRAAVGDQELGAALAAVLEKSGILTQ